MQTQKNKKMKTFKHFSLSLALLIGAFSLGYSQSASNIFGIKAGLNNASDESFDADLAQFKTNPLSSTGFHVGFYKQYGSNSFFFRPEVIYTTTITKFDEGDLESQSLDIPLNLGMKVLGPLYLTAGPVLQNLLNSEYADQVLEEGSKKMRVLANFGAGVSLGNVKVELRYERGLKEKEFNFLQGITEASDARISNTGNQFIFSLFIPLSIK